jgi:hypothetical protein
MLVEIRVRAGTGVNGDRAEEKELAFCLCAFCFVLAFFIVSLFLLCQFFLLDRFFYHIVFLLHGAPSLKGARSTQLANPSTYQQGKLKNEPYF